MWEVRVSLRGEHNAMKGTSREVHPRNEGSTRESEEIIKAFRAYGRKYRAVFPRPGVQGNPETGGKQKSVSDASVMLRLKLVRLDVICRKRLSFSCTRSQQRIIGDKYKLFRILSSGGKME